jgi:hypothetical protein
MLQLHDGQCGLCQHFGEEHSSKKEIVEVRMKHSASATFVDDCAHPKHVSLHLKVTPMSGCDGFAPAMKN